MPLIKTTTNKVKRAEEIKAKIIVGVSEIDFAGKTLNKPLGAGEAMLLIEE